MNKLFKNIALVTTGLVVGVVGGRREIKESKSNTISEVDLFKQRIYSLELIVQDLLDRLEK
ncbi:hypothetical protein [Facklamia miroungae]|uniref:Uncharacterized protein n=1 Tax=Facklamia miroungae TaxID=120956 RepID=A0A1G7NYE7_9LACT|nr:hypothetical protein [Facklamia miroungae]NKZ28513.1 hypothetical protein [Facklamia miroungae]SDF78981.1 hypothetical protein SAMN05421791_10154 [Facklamia miroungae]